MDRPHTSLGDNRTRNSLSFASTLLEDMLLHKDEHEEMARLRRACLIEKWMKKKVNEKVVQLKARSDASRRDPSWLSHSSSSSSSSDSSFGSGFSFSEWESGCRTSKPKMILPEKFNRQMSSKQNDSSREKHENGYLNTKSKSKAAMKMYNGFKDSKQPLSPGGRLTSFLNSLFTTSSTKRTKTKYDPKSTCSSASSCLSKTQSSRAKLSSSNVADPRSVKLCPVNIILDEYYQIASGPSFESMKHRDIRNNSMREDLKLQILERNRRLEEVATQDLGKRCHKSTLYVKREIDVKSEHRSEKNRITDDSEEEEDDDAASYASSDLFELDSLSAIGMDEELPMYETTQYLSINGVIPNGFIL